MPLQIYKFFDIFVVYFQVLLSNVGNSRVGTHFYGFIKIWVIFATTCPPV